MPLPLVDTLVTYPDGAVTSSGTVLHVERLDGDRSAVIVDRTAFHPVDTAWPDQPADRGELRSGARTIAIVDAVTGGIHDGALFVGADLPVRTGTPEWTFVVAHVIEGETPVVGDAVEIDVDAAHRAALSRGHTACHLASLALDAALAGAWTKPVPADALGAPAFDALAIQTSRIHPDGSTDVYRIGKSLRRKGFSAPALDEVTEVAARTNALLAEWTAAGGAVRIERSAEHLSARRTWVCELPGARAEIPCGGTHVTDLADLGTVRVDLVRTDVEGGVQLEMTTTVTP